MGGSIHLSLFQDCQQTEIWCFRVLSILTPGTQVSNIDTQFERMFTRIEDIYSSVASELLLINGKEGIERLFAELARVVKTAVLIQSGDASHFLLGQLETK